MWVVGRSGQSHADKLDVWLDALHGGDHGIVEAGIGLWREIVLEVNFVQHFPVSYVVVISGFVAHSKFVGKPAFGVPGEEAGVIISNLLASGIAQLRTF